MRIVVIGAGAVGRHLATSVDPDASVVVVDRDDSQLQIAEESLDALTLRGDGTHRRTLEAAEVARADLVVAVTDNDTVNLTAAALASTMGARRTIARVDDPGFYATDAPFEREVLGIHAVLCASRLVGSALLRMLTGRYCRITHALEGGMLHGVVVTVPEDSPAIGQAPGRLRVGGTGCVRAVYRGARLRSVSDVTEVAAGDDLILIGRPATVARSVHFIHKRDRARALLVGGGEIGTLLASAMSAYERDVRIIELDRQRCEVVAADLPTVRVIHGDGTNLTLLRDERVGLCGSLCAVTHSDEVNLMASLLGKELGVGSTLALVHRPGYAPVYDHLGIDGTTSAHECLAAALRSLTPGRRIIERWRIEPTPFEVVEVRAPKLTGRIRARDLPIPAGALLLGVHAGDGGALRSEAPLNGGEHLLIGLRSAQVNELDSALNRLERKGGV